jgi:hypothetical protein
MKKIIRKMDTAESRAFWEAAEKSAAGVKDWPDWKRGGINTSNQRTEPREIEKDAMAEKKPTIIPEKQYFTVKVECTLPATLSYRILAETPEQAMELIKNVQPINVQYRLQGKKGIKATVYNMGTSMIRLIQNMMGKQW